MRCVLSNVCNPIERVWNWAIKKEKKLTSMTGGVFQAIFWTELTKLLKQWLVNLTPLTRPWRTKTQQKRPASIERLRQGEKFTPQEGLGTLGAELAGAWEV